MNKLTWILILIFLFTFVIVPIALAQNTTPSNDLTNAAAALIAAFGALVANFIITFLKTVPYLGQTDKDKLAQAVTEVVSVAVGLVTGYLIGLIAKYLGLVDSNLQVTLIAALTPVLNEARYRVAKLAPQA